MRKTKRVLRNSNSASPSKKEYAIKGVNGYCDWEITFEKIGDKDFKGVSTEDMLLDDVNFRIVSEKLL